MAIVEANVESVWWAKQTAQGASTALATKKGRKVSGSLPQTNTAYNHEDFSDGSRFGTATDFIDTIQGSGAPGIQAQSGTFAHLCWLMLGSESVTGAGPFQHTITPGSISFWTTWWKRLGSSLIMREKYNDCRISSMVIEGSSGQKVIRITPTLLSLDPGVIVNADPVRADDGTEPLNYNFCQGSFSIDGTVFTGHSAFSVTVSDDLQAYRGDAPTINALAPGRGTVDLNATILLDDAGLAQLYKIYYGSTAPTSGQRPTTATLPSLGTYQFIATASASEIIKVKFYGIRWSPPDQPDGSPAGGPITLSLTGGGRILASNPMIEITVTNADAAYTV